MTPNLSRHNVTNGRGHDVHCAIPSSPQQPQSPPPPPPPPPPPARTHYTEVPAQSGQHDDLFDQIEDQQDVLRDVREKLVGARYRLRKRRRELRSIREATAIKAAIAFKRIKHYVLEQGLYLPPDIQSAMDDADVSRDRLGEEELDFEEAEEKYGLEEWIYSDKETKFVEGLFAMRFTNFQVAPAQQSSSADNVISESLTQHSRGSAITWHAANVADTLIISPGASHVDASSAFDVDIGVPDDAQIPVESLALFQHSYVSLSANASPGEYAESNQALVRPFRENGSTLARSRWPEIRQRIDEWLLETLRDSRFQKAQLRNLLSREDLGNNDWWQLALQEWSTQGPDDLAFHTGDTTVPSFDASAPISAATMQKLFEESEQLDPERRPSSAIPLVLDDQNLDALEPIEFPSEVKLSEMLGRTPKKVKFKDRSPSALSLSTQPTIGTKSSSEKVPSSVSSVDTNYAQVASNTTGSVGHKRVLDGVDVGIESEYTKDSEITSPLPMDEALSLPNPITNSSDLRQGQPLNAKVIPFEFSVEEAHAPNGDNKPLLSSGPGTPSQVSEPRQRLIVGSGPPTGDRSPFQAAKRQTRYPFAPFIRIKSPEPWSLPLLRLTPLPTPPFDRTSWAWGRNQLENLPFVSISDTPSRLPGPYGFLGMSSTDVY
jgi:hypothetical protein